MRRSESYGGSRKSLPGMISGEVRSITSLAFPFTGVDGLSGGVVLKAASLAFPFTGVDGLSGGVVPKVNR